MRYPLWAFLVLVLVPPFTFHAVLTGKAGFRDTPRQQVASIARPVEVSLVNTYRF